MSVREVATIVSLVAMVFAAGGVWAGQIFAVKQLRKDLNGAMKKTAQQMSERELEDDRLRLALILIAPAAKREELIARFWRE